MTEGGGYKRLPGASTSVLTLPSVFTRRSYLLGASVLGLFITLFVYYRATAGSDYKLYYTLLRAVPSQDTCAIPHTDPWDATIQKYLATASPLVCKRLQAEITYLDDDGILRINKSEVTSAGYGELVCQYRCFDRKQATDDVTLDFSEWQTLKESFLGKRPASKSAEKSTSKANKRKQPSVLLFVLDSVSQANWVRNLPETLKVLKNEYGSHIFRGFTKVGDNSFPNAVAFLTGKRVMTAGYSSELPDDMSKTFFDDWPLAWKDFADVGYTTYYAEDYPQFNLFKYLALGFKNQPTDHYFRPYWLQLYGSFLHRRSTHLCYGNNPSHSLQLNYLKQFVSKYKDSPTFALNWMTELGHDWLNQVAVGDQDLATFFREQRENLKDSFVFVFSDHGHRFDPIRQSVIGRIEERMPFFSMHVPEWLTRERPYLNDVLRNNSEQLSSFWDLYITLRDILSNQKTGEWELTSQPTSWKAVAPRGLSLLRPLPVKRTCEDAGIPEDFCICQRETFVNVTDPKVVEAADILIRHINTMLRDYPQECARLQLKNIHHAQTFLPNINMVLDPSVSIFYGGQNPTGFYVNYRVTIEVAPSHGLFEGTLRNSVRDQTFTVIGDVNRINKYGNQSLCVKSALLRKYCYCLV